MLRKGPTRPATKRKAASGEGKPEADSTFPRARQGPGTANDERKRHPRRQTEVSLDSAASDQINRIMYAGMPHRGQLTASESTLLAVAPLHALGHSGRPRLFGA